MFGTHRLTTKENPKGGFTAYLHKQKKEVSSDYLFGPISDQILEHLDNLEDDQELLLQEDKVLATRQTEISPSGQGLKRSP